MKKNVEELSYIIYNLFVDKELFIIMVNIVDPRQNELFDLFKGFLSPLAYKTLISGWQGVFRRVILKVLPAPEIANHFNPTFGRPTKE